MRARQIAEALAGLCTLAANAQGSSTRLAALPEARWSAETRAQLVEIPFLVGEYTMPSTVAEGLGVPVEPELPLLPPID